ncbi:MAG TPA: diacylglycerol kinase family protein [Thermoanaerobaculia bacterium]|nr:diacylglycerol kinase family protein [Thermoanaerobaculia bacterium]
MKALFLINARSGARRNPALEQIIRDSAFAHEIVGCGSKEELDGILADAEASGFDVAYAVGGDGTVHEIAKRLVGRQLALGVLPTGSGNGFARHLHLPLDATLSLAACADGEIVTIDTAEVNGTPYVGVMGIGFDAVIAHRFAEAGTRGLQTYVREGLKAFTTLKAEDYEVDGRKMRAAVIAIANSSQYGNDARVAPLASLRDGLLDIVIVDDITMMRAPFLLQRLFAGTFHRAAGVSTRQSAAVTIRRAAAGAAHLDGEPVMLDAELRVRIVPQSLRVLVPRGVSV